MYIEFKDCDVDGCGTDVSVIVEINSDSLTNGTKERIKEEISNYKKENKENWDTYGCVNAASKQLEKEGYKVKYIIPTETISF